MRLFFFALLILFATNASSQNTQHQEELDNYYSTILQKNDKPGQQKSLLKMYILMYQLQYSLNEQLCCRDKYIDAKIRTIDLIMQLKEYNDLKTIIDGDVKVENNDLYSYKLLIAKSINSLVCNDCSSAQNFFMNSNSLLKKSIQVKNKKDVLTQTISWYQEIAQIDTLSSSQIKLINKIIKMYKF